MSSRRPRTPPAHSAKDTSGGSWSSRSKPLSSRAVARQYFGTDGVRGVVGETLTADLVERLGKAAALWCGRGRIFVGRDTRASGPDLEDAFAGGIASAGGRARLSGRLR